VNKKCVAKVFGILNGRKRAPRHEPDSDPTSETTSHKKPRPKPGLKHKPIHKKTTRKLFDSLVNFSNLARLNHNKVKL